VIQSFKILIFAKYFKHLLRDSIWELHNTFRIVKEAFFLLLIRILSVLLEINFVILSHWSQYCLENNIIPYIVSLN
jgi:hypothetical protein